MLDRIAGCDRNSENSLLQFVSRSTVTSYASSAPFEAILKGDGTSEESDSYGLARRIVDPENWTTG